LRPAISFISKLLCGVENPISTPKYASHHFFIVQEQGELTSAFVRNFHIVAPIARDVEIAHFSVRMYALQLAKLHAIPRLCDYSDKISFLEFWVIA